MLFSIKLTIVLFQVQYFKKQLISRWERVNPSPLLIHHTVEGRLENWRKFHIGLMIILEVCGDNNNIWCRMNCYTSSHDIIIIYDCTEDVRVGVISKHNNIMIVGTWGVSEYRKRTNINYYHRIYYYIRAHNIIII